MGACVSTARGPGAPAGARLNDSPRDTECYAWGGKGAAAGAAARTADLVGAAAAPPAPPPRASGRLDAATLQVRAGAAGGVRHPRAGAATARAPRRARRRAAGHVGSGAARHTARATSRARPQTSHAAPPRPPTPPQPPPPPSA
jgi:hypothetical protein